MPVQYVLHNVFTFSRTVQSDYPERVNPEHLCNKFSLARSQSTDSFFIGKLGKLKINARIIGARNSAKMF